MQSHHPITIFILWIGELIVTTLVSIHLDFNWNDFRVWSSWVLAVILGIMQFIIHRKTFKASMIEWWKETKEKDCHCKKD